MNTTHCMTCYFSQSLIYQCCPRKPKDLLIILSPAARPAVICLELQMNAPPHPPTFSTQHYKISLPWLLIKALKNILSVNKQLLIMPGFDLYFVLIHQTSLNGFFHTLQISLKEAPWNNASNSPWVQGVGCQKTTYGLLQSYEWKEWLVMLPAPVKSELG